MGCTERHTGLGHPPPAALTANAIPKSAILGRPLSRRMFSGFPGVVQRQDAGVLQIGGRLDLARKRSGTDHRGQFRTQDLESNLALVPEVLGQIDESHSGGAELPLDTVAVGDGVREAFRDFGHAH